MVYWDKKTDRKTERSYAMDIERTYGEQNLLMLSTAIPASEKFYIWCYADDGHLIISSCPEEDREILAKAFSLSGGLKKALSHAGTGQDNKPFLIGSPFEMQWSVTYDNTRNFDLIFVMGPVFYSVPDKNQIRKALQANYETACDPEWTNQFLSRLSAYPVMPYSVFSRYTALAYNALTLQQIDLSDVFSASGHTQPQAISETRDRTEVYAAECALLQMVRTGDICYQPILNRCISLNAGLSVKGKSALDRARTSVIVFTTLVCRAAIEGGLSPSAAYSINDSYIESVLASSNSGELQALSTVMYHDFIQRVHQLKNNPMYSPATQKCCDYIQLNLNKKIEISELAALTGYTDYYLSRKFKKETGMPLFLYVRKAKIERAKILLESTDYRVSEISDELAFDTQNYFIKCFREICGCSPVQYRNNCLKNRAADHP